MPAHMAGTEVYTHTIATLQKERGQQVAVVTPHIEFYRPGQITPHYLYEGIDVYQFQEAGDPTDKDFITGKKMSQGLNNFKNLLLSLNADIIHFHELNRSTGLTVQHVKVAKQLGCKVFITMHLSFYTCNTNILIKNKQLCNGKIDTYDCTNCTYNSMFKIPVVVSVPLAKVSLFLNKLNIEKLLPKGKFTTLISVPASIQRIKSELTELAQYSDQIIALTNWYKDILLLNGVPKNKIAVIPQALAPGGTKARRSELINSLAFPIRIVFLGRIQPQKAVHLLIEACKGFTAAAITLDIYGKEEDTSYYKNCRVQSVNQANVFWKGLLDRDEVVETLAQYDILCLPSMFSEMSPLVIQEAFAAGIPVLGSCVYGNIEHIRDGENGLLFDFGSAADLRKKIRALVDDPNLINHLKSNVKSPRQFDSVAAAYAELYGR